MRAQAQYCAGAPGVWTLHVLGSDVFKSTYFVACTSATYLPRSNGYVDLTSAAVIGASALLTASAGAAATHKFDCAKLR
eukprot:scaffold170301_cov12-Tisochrysis_lutea.AAC.1